MWIPRSTFSLSAVEDRLGLGGSRRAKRWEINKTVTYLPFHGAGVHALSAHASILFPSLSFQTDWPYSRLDPSLSCHGSSAQYTQQLKRGAKHFNLASQPLPRACRGACSHPEFLRPLLPTLSYTFGAERREGGRLVYAREESERVETTRRKKKRRRMREGGETAQRPGETGMNRKIEKWRETEGEDGLTPVCLRGANGVLQLF